MNIAELEKALLGTVDQFEKDLAFTAPEAIFTRTMQLRERIMDIMDELKEEE
jgi:hypothetical protein